MSAVQRVLFYVSVAHLGIQPVTPAVLVLCCVQKAPQGIQLLGLD